MSEERNGTVSQFGSMKILQGAADQTPVQQRSVVEAMKRGFRNRCPNCGQAALFRAFLKPVDRCPSCGEEMHHHRADDLPAYLVALIVGHVMVGGWLMTETLWHLSSWQHIAIWSPATVVAALLLLQPVKGAVIGLQWANRMHGFGDPQDDPATMPLREPASNA